MDETLKSRFIAVLIRFKKTDVCFAADSPVSLSEFIVLGKVSNGCGCGAGPSVSELYENLHLSKPAVSQTLNALEHRGYVVREINPHDRRRVTVSITKKGSEVLENAVRCYDGALDELFRLYGEENIRLLTRQLNRFVELYEQLRCERRQK